LLCKNLLSADQGKESMKLKLVVLAGAKEGLEIPLKKEKFLIGRAKECALRAGSEAISRQHCAISRHENGYTVKDLGSRNGTHVNDKRITEEVPLVAGNELRVGPLKFRVDVLAEKPKDKEAKPALPALMPAAPDAKKKQPPVKDVADVVQRTINKSDNMSEDDVSRWLLGVTDVDGPETLKETRSLRAEETRTTMTRVTVGETSTIEDVSKLPEGDALEDEETAESSGDAKDVTEGEEEGGSGVWKWLKRGKGGKGPAPKKKPGKLPPRSDLGPLKDSREAAADILREMQRRR
jgi:pSer/pThr/pTyr-binding forkhead associated (FHA) protein